MEFVQAKNYTRTGGRQIDLIVIHDMEAPEKGETAENIANWFAGRNAPRASAHYNIDVNSIVQSVRDKDVAWHAPGANHDGIGLEHAGYAKQSAAEWTDEYSTTMLRDQSAPLCRELCNKYDIPVRYVDRHGLLRGERGITTHNEVSEAFKKSTHWDPGPNFPMDQYLAWVNESNAPVSSNPDPVPVESGLLRQGDQGARVKEWQKLVGATPDGIFGPKTKAATEEFQRKMGITVDGVVGPETRKAMAKLLNFLASQDKQKKAPKSQSTSKTPKYPGRTYSNGDRGKTVTKIQTQLRDNASQDIAVDGIFGPETEEAVKNVQRFFDLDVDGIVGPDTWGVLWL